MSNVVPAGWKVLALKEFCKGIRGVTYKPTDLFQSMRSDSITLLRSNNIQDKGLVFDEVQYVDCKKVKNSQIAGRGDIAVCMSNGSKRLVGKSARFRDLNTRYTVGAFCSIFRPNGSVFSDYISHIFKSDAYYKQVDFSLAGSAINNLKNSDVEEYQFSIPTFLEQKKIAAILNSVDDVIKKTQAQIDKIKDLKKGMMQELLTCGVGANGKLHTEFKDSPVGRVPAEWDVVQLSSVLSKVDSGWSPACIEMPPATGEWGVVKVSAVTRGCFLEKESKTLPKELKPKPHIQIKRGDILLTRANGVADLVGKCVMVSSEPKAKLMMSDKILRLNVNDKVYSKFLLHYFNSRQIRKQIELSWGGSSGQKNISQADIKGYFIALPSLNEQMVIGDSISQIDTLLSVKEAKLRKLEDSKKGLMQDLLTGKVRVKVDS
ncbi:restriction endonuclease subunit S [Vibrio alginolyticus]|nr:restriction endonuclease subunit S [Vibrio alginolyticus]